MSLCMAELDALETRNRNTDHVVVLYVSSIHAPFGIENRLNGGSKSARRRYTRYKAGSLVCGSSQGDT